MSKKEIVGLTTQDALNVIRQKHLKDLDAEDIAFLRANEELLSKIDVLIYIEGMSPKKAAEEAGDTVFNSANDRIIHENRSLKDNRPVPTPAPVEISAEETDEMWADKITSLNKEADVLERDEKEAAKKAKEDADEEAKEAKKAKK